MVILRKKIGFWLKKPLGFWQEKLIELLAQVVSSRYQIVSGQAERSSILCAMYSLFVTCQGQKIRTNSIQCHTKYKRVSGHTWWGPSTRGSWIVVILFGSVSSLTFFVVFFRRLCRPEEYTQNALMHPIMLYIGQAEFHHRKLFLAYL